MAEVTGVPVSAPPPQPPRPQSAWALVHTAALSAAAIALLLLGVLAGRYVLVGVLIPLQVLLALTWLAALMTPGLFWSAGVAVGAGVVADLLCATGPAGVRRLAGVLAVSLLVAMVMQVLRRDPRLELTASLGSTLAGTVFVLAMSVLVALRRSDTGRDAAMAALIGTGAAIVVARLVDAVRLRGGGVGMRRRSALGLAAGGALAVLIGAGIGAAEDTLSVGDGIALAAAAAAIALACDIGLDMARAGVSGGSENDRARAALLPLAVLLPITVAVPAAYVTGRILLS
ncbi:MAG: hypothetical protein ACJ735_02025 [Actinomycetes bacterium]